MILGIDPGVNGALAFLDDDFFHVVDMPYYDLKVGKSKRKRVNPWMLSHYIQKHVDRIAHAFVEQVNPRPNEGVVSSFTSGYGFGAIESVLLINDIDFTVVQPKDWKKELKCPKDKDGARMRATQLFPKNACYWPLKKHDGRAEAAMIALYGIKKHIDN